jgi:hypothetical protein
VLVSLWLTRSARLAPSGELQRSGPRPVLPERGSHRSIEALAFCDDCSVRSECLASALAVASTTGVRGGTTGWGHQGLAVQRGVKMLQPSPQPDSR